MVSLAPPIQPVAHNPMHRPRPIPNHRLWLIKERLPFIQAGNTHVNGAQVEGQGVVVNAGETLKVGAVQAVNQSTETINGISIGATMGMDSGHSNAKRAWVDDQTHIIGHQSVATP